LYPTLQIPFFSPFAQGVETMKCSTGFLAALLACAILHSGFAQESSERQFPKLRFVTSKPKVQDMWPCFSPDSQTLLFTRTTDHKIWNLFTVAVSGGEPSPFPAKSPASGTRANWSAKHNVIAFNGQPPKGQFNLSLIKGDGSGLRLLEPAGISDRMSYPSWYPDGKSVAVVDFSYDQGSAIKRIDIEKEMVVRLTDPKTHWAGVPRVSPDGNHIVMGGQVRRGQRYSQYRNQIWILDRDGKLRSLDSKRGWAPFWSPDGKWIVFASDRGSDSGLWAIFVASPDGATVRQLTHPELNAGHPTWSPDGKLIAFFAQFSSDKTVRGLAILEADAVLSIINRN
jgi:Tol biopolymer transport system component